jgi:hypothetical protein
MVALFPPLSGLMDSQKTKPIATKAPRDQENHNKSRFFTWCPWCLGDKFLLL